jgi:hypothetical protein
VAAAGLLRNTRRPSGADGRTRPRRPLGPPDRPVPAPDGRWDPRTGRCRRRRAAAGCHPLADQVSSLWAADRRWSGLIPPVHSPANTTPHDPSSLEPLQRDRGHFWPPHKAPGLRFDPAAARSTEIGAAGHGRSDRGRGLSARFLWITHPDPAGDGGDGSSLVLGRRRHRSRAPGHDRQRKCRSIHQLSAGSPGDLRGRVPPEYSWPECHRRSHPARRSRGLPARPLRGRFDGRTHVSGYPRRLQRCDRRPIAPRPRPSPPPHSAGEYFGGSRPSHRLQRPARPHPPPDRPRNSRSIWRYSTGPSAARPTPVYHRFMQAA